MRENDKRGEKKETFANVKEEKKKKKQFKTMNINS